MYAAQAQDEFERGRYTTSAQCFAKSNVPFDQVVLKFTRVKEKDALRYYLIHRLERLGPNVIRLFLSVIVYLYKKKKIGSYSEDVGCDLAG